MPTDALPWVYLAGRMVSARSASVSVFDRSFQMGDGLFETIRMMNGWPIQWRQHWRRFSKTAARLGIHPPVTAAGCLKILEQLLERCHQTDAAARIHLSRGIGPRGYSPARARLPTLVVSLHPAPPITSGKPRMIRVGLSSFRAIDHAVLQQNKTASRILHVLARAEADGGKFDDLLMLDARDRVLEATSSNFFWFRGSTLITPPADSGILPGTTRATVIQIARRLKVPVRESASPLKRVLAGDGAFLTVCTGGILEITRIANHPLPRNPLTTELQRKLITAWRREAQRFGRET